MPLINDDLIVTKEILGEDIEVTVIDNFFNDIEEIIKMRELIGPVYTKDQYPGKKKRIYSPIFKRCLLARSPDLPCCADYPHPLTATEIESAIADNPICVEFFNNLTNEIKKLEKYLTVDYKLVHGIYYGHVCTEPQSLNKFQSQPHIDTRGGERLYSILIYINKDEYCHGGTGFYRHKESGIIRVSNEIDELGKNRGADLLVSEKAKIKTPNYITDTNDVWELVKMIPMKQNRAVIYDANIFHSTYIKDVNLFKDDGGRKTINIFFAYNNRV